MSAPSRRPEIRRRRTRDEKMTKLRKAFAKAGEAEKTKIFAKVYKMTPQLTRAEFEKANRA